MSTKTSSGRNLPATIAVALLILALMPVLAGCDEKSFGPARLDSSSKNTEEAATSGSAAAALPEAPAPTGPTLTVGNVQMPMPVPDNFKRIPHDHPLTRASQATIGSEETLLCLFEKENGTSADSSLESLLQRDTLIISTLSKWLNAHIPAPDFLKNTRQWQEESIVFNQNILTFFEEAATTRLADHQQFKYDLGMIDSGPLHISFLKVIKHTTPEEEVIYICNTNSLIWRYGKILRVSYNRNISDFSQIQAVVAESISYLNKLLSIDRAPGGPEVPAS